MGESSRVTKQGVPGPGGGQGKWYVPPGRKGPSLEEATGVPGQGNVARLSNMSFIVYYEILGKSVTLPESWFSHP